MPIGRRRVIAPTARAEGPLPQYASTVHGAMCQDDARIALLESDPALSADAAAALAPDRRPVADAVALPPPPASDVHCSAERCPSRLFLTE
eukprot:6802892-Pyramimonas_sp.AAC.1